MCGGRGARPMRSAGRVPRTDAGRRTNRLDAHHRARGRSAARTKKEAMGSPAQSRWRGRVLKVMDTAGFISEVKYVVTLAASGLMASAIERARADRRAHKRRRGH